MLKRPVYGRKYIAFVSIHPAPARTFKTLIRRLVLAAQLLKDDHDLNDNANMWQRRNARIWSWFLRWNRCHILLIKIEKVTCFNSSERWKRILDKNLALFYSSFASCVAHKPQSIEKEFVGVYKDISASQLHDEHYSVRYEKDVYSRAEALRTKIVPQ